MGDKKKKKGSPNSGNIEEILRERERLEQILTDKFKKEVVILFTDICGYTKYTEIHGDISGRALLERHNTMVIPLIEAYEGVVIKTIGDAIMASFSDPLAALRAAIAIQKALHDYNDTADEIKRIHVKIGINRGEALVDAGDMYGDAVNVTSRIISQAGADQILIGRSLYEKVKGMDDILCRFHAAVQVKGKAAPLELYRVVWQDEDMVISTEPRVRAYEEAAIKTAQAPPTVFLLEVARVDSRLKISTSEHRAGEASTIRQYEEVPVALGWIENKCHEMVETLNMVSRKGQARKEVLVKLRETGRIFYEELLPPSIREKIRETRASYLSLSLDDKLVQVPWELLNDSQEFLCQRFNMGRLVKTRQSLQGARARVLARPLKMLIIADPKGDLKGAYREGVQLKEFMEQQYRQFTTVTLRSQNITPSFLMERIRYFDMVHFAGHADYDQESPGRSGWRLTTGSLYAEDIIRMAGSSSMPALIFANACQSARTEEWALGEHFQDEIFGLANAFLLAGVKHYVGTFWEILDEPGSLFALEFYKHLLSGKAMGESVQKARLRLMEEYGEESIVWASYLLYGDPTSNYMDQIRLAETEEEREEACITTSDARVRSLEVERDLFERKAPVGFRTWIAVSAGIGLALLILIVFMLMQLGREKQPARQAARTQEVIIPQIAGGAADSDLQKTAQIIHLLSTYQDQLASRFKEGGFEKRVKEQDAWTSTPMNICMISPPWEKLDPDTAALWRSQFEMLFSRMTGAFTGTHSLGLSILERERLSAILQELQIGVPSLSADSLKDAYTILSARVILFPAPVSYKVNQEVIPEVSLRMVETRSSRIIAAFSKGFTSSQESIDKAAASLVQRTVQALEMEYPLQGRIVSVDGEKVEINLGTGVGVSQDQSFSVLGSTEKDLPKGMIRIKVVYEKTALAKVTEKGQPFEAGDRIRVVPSRAASE